MSEDPFQLELFDRPMASMSDQLEGLRLCHRERLRLQTCDAAVQAVGPLILALARLAAQRDARPARRGDQ